MLKRITSFSVILLLVFTLVSCKNESKPTENLKDRSDNYRNFYEIFVYSFCDSDGDGIGDLKGVTSKLGYLSDDLKIDGIWLMPIMPSDTYHKYDVKDYMNIDEQYGTLEDFNELVKECDKRGIKVVMDLMLNHSSSNHPWFKEAVNALNEGKESKYTDYYNFVKTMPETGKYANTGLTNGMYYEANFVDFMPDFNMDSEALREEIKKIAEFWINRGVDGFRLDAAKHVYNEKEKNIEFFKWFNSYCKTLDKDFYTIGEVWSNQDEVLSYYKGGFTSLFNFTFGTDTGQIAYGMKTSLGKYFAEGLEKYQTKMKENNPSAIDAVFLTNHDNNRIASKVEEDPVMLRRMASVYLLMPGSIFIYYGEELGMTGEGPDENKRSPMIWSKTDKTGKTEGPPGMGEVKEVSKGVKEQLEDTTSLLNFYKMMLEMRNRHPEFAKGTVKALNLGDDTICAYSTEFEGSKLTVVHNTSREEKTVTLAGTGALAESVICDKGEVKLEGRTLTLPPCSSAIIK